jgi:ribA/ribD-fused uncharacterized protein
MPIKKMRAKKVSRPVFFHESEGYMLSNLSAHEVYYGGMPFKTAEHAYQAFKFDGITTVFMDIVRARSPMEARSIVIKHEGLVRKDWDRVKYSLMKDILKTKLKQHKEVRDYLFSTGDRELVSGVENHLGRIWMELRQSNE